MQHISNIAELRSYVQGGHAVDYLFFWGHRQKKDGSISRSCLSNWYPAPFSLEGTAYATTEHYMMAQKAKLFGDSEMFSRILLADNPEKAKTLGREVRGFDGNLWYAHRVDIVVAGNEAKFSQHRVLKDYLISTGEKILVEASPYDKIWGIGLAAKDRRVKDPDAWKGLNLLGFALMEVRRRLQHR